MKVIVTGSVSFDQIMSMPGRFKDYLMPDKLHILNVSFLMETFRKEMGGTAGNQAYTLALLGWRAKLAATVGKDFGEYRKHLETAGVDLSLTQMFKNEVTANGFAMTDKTNNQIWGFYSGAMARAKNLSLKKIIKAEDWVVIAPNDPKAMENYVEECVAAKCRFLFDPAFQIPRLKLSVLKKGVMKAAILIGNDYEISLLRKRLKLTKSQILKSGVVLVTTYGEKGSMIEKGFEAIKIPAAKPENNSDPTGAGDAYRAGFLAGYLKGLPLSACGRMGAVAAIYTVEKYGTQSHKFTLTEFKKRYKSNFKEELKYEI